jgi:transcriptional regulator with XRE-family HTH domain
MEDAKFLMKLGTGIRNIRKQKNISQQQLAGLCAFEKASMSRIESGKINVSVLTLKKISKALKRPMRDFF